MKNRDLYNLIESKTPLFRSLYSKNQYRVIINENNKILSVLETENQIPKVYKNYQNRVALTHSLGNHKIGADTLCISFNCGVLCYMSVLGECSNCGVCYAKNQNLQYLKNTIPKNLINTNIILKVLLGEISLHKLLFELIYDINCKYKTEINNLKYIRFSVEGDILNNKMLNIVNKIAECLITVFDLICAYSYTHNKSLDLSLADNICFNTSDFENKYYGKSCITIEKLTTQLREKIFNREIILCNGDCTNCSYCKNIKDKRPIYFLLHGGKYKGVKTLDSKIKEFIENQKQRDYKKFIADCGDNSTD